MWERLKKIFIRKEIKGPIRPIRYNEDDDRELLELKLLQEDICGKHHG